MSQRMCMVDCDHKTFVIKEVKDSVENNWHKIVHHLRGKGRDLIISVEYTSEYCMSRGWERDEMLVERLLSEYNDDFIGTDKFISMDGI